MTDIKLVVGQSARADGAAFVDAWSRAESGDLFEDHALTFQSWDALAAVMSAERLSLLRYVHAHPEISIEALAGSLGRQHPAVEQDVSALARTGLLKVHGGLVEKTVDRIQAVIAFD